MSATPMSVLLKQLVSLTRPMRGSPGSAKVMSTHYHHTRQVSWGWCFLGERGETNRVQRGAVQGQLDDLDGCVVASLDGGVDREGHLGQADGARVGVARGADDLEGVDHGVAHVGRAVEAGSELGPFVAEAHVDVDEGRRVALEPAWLEGDGAACCRPEGAVCCRGHAAAWFRR